MVSGWVFEWLSVLTCSIINTNWEDRTCPGSHSGSALHGFKWPELREPWGGLAGVPSCQLDGRGTCTSLSRPGLAWAHWVTVAISLLLNLAQQSSQLRSFISQWLISFTSHWLFQLEQDYSNSQSGMNEAIFLSIWGVKLWHVVSKQLVIFIFRQVHVNWNIPFCFPFLTQSVKEWMKVIIYHRVLTVNQESG